MNRREALAALMALPTVSSVARAEVRPDDVIVVRGPGRFNQKEAEELRTYLKIIWPDNKCVVLGDAMTLEVVRKS